MSLGLHTTLPVSVEETCKMLTGQILQQACDRQQQAPDQKAKTQSNSCYSVMHLLTELITYALCAFSCCACLSVKSAFRIYIPEGPSRPFQVAAQGFG